uniref:Uncharacterized protein n=1 Tax=Gossypium raimondii TaxID=29730 RepID=A0A0D2PJE8_GOSRA|nr:hypothetical protein B456_001G226200 [Gossypium raimondii]
MDPEGKKFGGGPRELSGAVDLISHYKLLPHHDFFCKRPLPVSISDTHYLHNVVGDTEIRKGEGMQLDQLIQNTSHNRDSNVRIQPFDLDILKEAFQLSETTPVELSVGFLLLLGSQRVKLKIKTGSIKSTRTEIRTRIKSIRSTSTVIKIKIEVKIKTRKKRRIEVGIMILVLITQKSTMKRKGSMMEMKILVMFTDTKKVSIKAQKLMKLVQLK